MAVLATLFVLSLPAVAWGKAAPLPPRKPAPPVSGGMEAEARLTLISHADAKTVRAVFQALDRNRFKDALRLTRQIKNPTLARALVWSYLTTTNAPVSFDDVRLFLDQHPDWPKRKTLLRRAEESMPANTPPQDVLAWFEVMGGPFSTTGRVSQGEAWLALGESVRGTQALRQAWVEGNFTKSQEKSFYRRHKGKLTRADHEARLDRLIWEERYWPAQRQMWRVDAKLRKLAVARLWLMRREGNVDKAIADLERSAPELLNHPGLVYERLRWRRRKGRLDGAAELFAAVAGDPVRPDKWWVERQMIARDLLKDRQPRDAYALVSAHGLTPQDAVEYSDAEWMSGWIALSFLNDPKRALGHFSHMHAVVNYPISVSRGAYWAGRAAEALGHSTEARTWMERAAQHPTTYYGQLARARLNLKGVAQPHPAPEVNGELAAAFARHPMKLAAQMLVEAGEQDRIRPFVEQLSDADPAPAWQALSAEFAARMGRPDLAIRIAKASERQGAPLGVIGYPAITPPRPGPFKDGDGVETPLVLAVIRQESAFYPGAQSHAGARGLMQVMPATAKRVARANRLPYDRDRLIQDPDYNLVIGQVYLSGMVEEFDGSYPLALAAYNAGPHRVRRWVRIYGDPRKGEVDLIDWMELIPFSETRNYVQRVLENLEVYRTTLGS